MEIAAKPQSPLGGPERKLWAEVFNVDTTVTIPHFPHFEDKTKLAAAALLNEIPSVSFFVHTNSDMKR